jgi:flavin reductase (DIM6/NTAB) family NADH-FMN oxidoreductase RutF
MTEDRRAIGALVGAADPPMIVVTTRAADTGERDGCLVGFHSQSSISPERYAVWLSDANRTSRLARTATHVAVHFLAVGDHAIAARFGALTGDELPDGGDGKLTGLAWRDGPGGVPVIVDVAHWFVGRIVARDARSDRGDHGWVELEVEASCDVDDGAPHEPLRLRAVTGLSPGHEA